MKLSIIIPYYNALKYTKELMKVLEPQLTNEVEIVIVDDGCNEKELDKFKAKVIHLDKNSGSASTPRNVGIENSTGENLVFVDADDMVTKDFVKVLLDKIDSEDFDYCLFSWHYNGEDVIIEDEPPVWNTSACNCIYKRTLIGNERFNPDIRIGEDGEFNSRVRKGKKANITKVLYFYNTTNEQSVTYNARGWKAIKHTNVLYANDLHMIGGVETYLYEMVKKYHKLDICVCYKTGDKNQIQRLKKLVPVYRVDENTKIFCKVAIINYDTSIIDQIVEGDVYQTIHGDYSNPHYQALGIAVHTDDRLKGYITITHYSEKSFEKLTGIKPMFSYNPLSIEEESEKPIILLSALRLRPEKGTERMKLLINALNKYNVNYLWYIFADEQWDVDDSHLVFIKPRLDLGYFMEQADYLVQLSDTECCSYSINEMLFRNKPVIVTPLPYLEEIGVKDGKNAYIMEFDGSNVEDIAKKITKIPKFEFKKFNDNYDKFLVKSKSTYEYVPDKKYLVRANRQWMIDSLIDSDLGYIPKEGEEYIVTEERLEVLLGNNPYKNKYVDVVKEIK